jgi:hypothetical protein
MGSVKGCRTWGPRGHTYGVLVGFSHAGGTSIRITSPLSVMSDCLFSASPCSNARSHEYGNDLVNVVNTLMLV